MARHRVNSNAVCSSQNYTQSKKLHREMLERNHDTLTQMIIREEIIIKKQAYVKVFGELMPLSQEEVIRLEKEVTIIYK